MNLSELIITRSVDYKHPQTVISTRTAEPECAELGGKFLERTQINQYWHNKPPLKRPLEPPTVISLAYALDCTELEVWIAILYTIGALKEEGPRSSAWVIVPGNGFTADQKQQIVHAAQAAADEVVARLTRTEQSQGD